MRFKRFIYSVLLILFSLILAADLAIWFLVPEAASVSAPDSSSFPQSMTFPGSGSDESSGSSGSRRPRRSPETSEETTDETAETAEATGFAAVLSRVLPVAQAVRPYRVYILVGAVLGMALCIVRLVFLHKKLRQLRAEEEAAEAGVSLKRVALWPAFLLLLAALVLVVLLFPVNEEEEAEDGAVANVQVVTGVVEQKTLTSLIQSAGYLEEQEAEPLTIPASVTVSSVCVKNGDAVTEGQIVAKADKVSVMKAIVSVHEALEEIDSQLQKAHDAQAETALSAPVAGTVKVVYAQVGEKALDVMNEYGSLMLLSLDGRMAVQVPAAEGLSMGSAATVTLSDGTELSGEVSFLEEGVATVTVADRGYAVGEQVSVKDESGALLGSGPLYVHKAYNITGYLGTVTRIYRREGNSAYAGVTLIGLSNASDLAEYEELLEQRHEYEEELITLFELYETGYIHAPCDGVVSGLADDLAYESLSAMVNGLTVRFASTGYWVEGDSPSLTTGTIQSVNGSDLEVSIVGQTITLHITGSTTIGYTNSYPVEGKEQQILVGDQIKFIAADDDTLIIASITHTDDSVVPQDPENPDDPTGDQGQGGTHGGSGGGFNGGGWNGGGISFGGKGGGSGSGSASKKPTYTIAEQELCTVTPQEKMLMTVSIDELDILSLSLGQEADLYLDALPSRGFTATVTEIADEGENDGGNTKFSVTLALDREADLYPGMNGTVCFPRSEGRDVLTVPLAALHEDGTRTQVYTAYDEETDQLLIPVEVKTGISDGTDVEIRSGLSLGTPYFYHYADSISYVTE